MTTLPANIDAPAPATLAEQAAAIRKLGKLAVGHIIEIGQRLTISTEWCAVRVASIPNSHGQSG